MRLRIGVRPDAKQVLRLQSIPWELIRDPEGGEFLALGRDVQIVRYLKLPRALPAPLCMGGEPLEVLIAIASPLDQVVLACETERQAIEQALSGGAFRVRTLVGATRESLAAELREHPPHVLHFIGHGGGPSSRRAGVICLERADRRSDLVPAHTLADMTRQNDALQLVFLNICSSGGLCASMQGLASSVGPGLALRGVPAVLAMKSPIRDQAAIGFASVFYRQLRTGATIESAMHAARVALAVRDSAEIEWPIAALFTRSREQPPAEAPRPSEPRQVTSLRVEAGEIKGEAVQIFARERDGGAHDSEAGNVEVDVRAGVIGGGVVTIAGTRVTKELDR